MVRNECFGHLRHDLDWVALLLAVPVGGYRVQVGLERDEFFVDALLPGLIKVVEIHFCFLLID